MKTIWTANLETEDEKERFKRSLLSSKVVLERLTEVIEMQLSSLNSLETGADIYTKPGWDALLAYYNGQKAILNWVKNLINLDKEITNDRRQSVG